MVNTKHQSHLDAIGENPQAAINSVKPFQPLLLPGLGDTSFVIDRLSHAVKIWNDAQVKFSLCKSLP